MDIRLRMMVEMLTSLLELMVVILRLKSMAQRLLSPTVDMELTGSVNKEKTGAGVNQC